MKRRHVRSERRNRLARIRARRLDAAIRRGWRLVTAQSRMLGRLDAAIRLMETT